MYHNFSWFLVKDLYWIIWGKKIQLIFKVRTSCLGNGIAKLQEPRCMELDCVCRGWGNLVNSGLDNPTKHQHFVRNKNSSQNFRQLFLKQMNQQ